MIQHFYLAIVCAATYGTLCIFIVIQSRHRTNLTLAGCCAVTSVWATSNTIWPEPLMAGPLGFLDMLRMLSWYVYLLHLYDRSRVAPKWQIRGFLMLATVAALLGIFDAFRTESVDSYSLLSISIAIRLVVSISELLLIENLYFNLPEYARWHVALPCILLGGVACFDILISADAVLYHRPSTSLISARTIIMVLFAPVLVLAAFRGQRWSEPVRLSRAAVFHSATLVLSGSVLVVLAVAGELLRRLDDELGWIAELSLLFSGLLGLLLFLSSRSARSVIQRIVTRHFFADRYDYRVQWLQCIGTLSGIGSNERTSLPVRAIRAVADIVNSPSGSLFMLDRDTELLFWIGSWNMPASIGLPLHDPIVQQVIDGNSVVDLTGYERSVDRLGPFVELGAVWLAVPLFHTSGVVGVVIVGPPRVPFRLDQEVFDLLQIIGREVATYVAEQRAAEMILQTRDLHDYSKKFAFVAHDIKNVSSQLALLLRNAELHLDNPEFQQDMLNTVRASVHKIDALLKRLDQRSDDGGIEALDPINRIKMLLEEYQRALKVDIKLWHQGLVGKVSISPEVLDTTLTHLINNAVEAGSHEPIEVRVRREGQRVIIDIVDRGKGMSADFIRDDLFTPFKTDRVGGSGIGAYQARELLREAGGQLLVISEQGIGTTMRVVLTGVDEHVASNLGETLPTLGDTIG